MLNRDKSMNYIKAQKISIFKKIAYITVLGAMITVSFPSQIKKIPSGDINDINAPQVVSEMIIETPVVNKEENAVIQAVEPEMEAQDYIKLSEAKEQELMKYLDHAKLEQNLSPVTSDFEYQIKIGNEMFHIGENRFGVTDENSTIIDGYNVDGNLTDFVEYLMNNIIELTPEQGDDFVKYLDSVKMEQNLSPNASDFKYEVRIGNKTIHIGENRFVVTDENQVIVDGNNSKINLIEYVETNLKPTNTVASKDNDVLSIGDDSEESDLGRLR